MCLLNYLDDDVDDSGRQLDKPKARRPCDCRNITKPVSLTRTICPSIPTATRVTPLPTPVTPSPAVGDNTTAAPDILTTGIYFCLVQKITFSNPVNKIANYVASPILNQSHYFMSVVYYKLNCY